MVPANRDNINPSLQLGKLAASVHSSRSERVNEGLIPSSEGPQLLYCRLWAAQGNAVVSLEALVKRGNGRRAVRREDNQQSRKERT